MGFTNPLSAAALAAALAATTLTVTGQVTTTPTTTTDEDEVRVYTQAQIDALTADDKKTNYLIYNTTTSAFNAVASGAVVIPAAPAAATSGVVNSGIAMPASSVFQDVTLFAAATGLTAVQFAIGAATEAATGAYYGGLWAVASTDPLKSIIVGANVNASGSESAKTFTSTTDVQTVNFQSGAVNISFRNLRYTASDGTVKANVANAAGGAAGTSNVRIAWLGIK